MAAAAAAGGSEGGQGNQGNKGDKGKQGDKWRGEGLAMTVATVMAMTATSDEDDYGVPLVKNVENADNEQKNHSEMWKNKIGNFFR